MIKFITFRPEREPNSNSIVVISATNSLNKWLKENPNVEIVDWRTTPVGTANELYITIQYKEN